MTRIELREACPEDNLALQRLSHACPMEAEISLSLERAPDFFALTRARGERSRTVVAETGGRIVGCASACRREAFLLGRPAEMGYVGDIKVAPGHRRQGLAQALLDELARGEQELAPAPYIGLTAAGNTAVDGMLLRFGATRTLQRLADMGSHELFPLRRLALPRGYRIERARGEDTAELCELLDRHHRLRLFAPVFAGGGLGRILARSPGMAVESYWLARRGGRIAAALGVWDEAMVKRTRVVRLTAVLRSAGRILRLAGRVLPVPAMPAEGELLRFVHLRHPARVEGGEEALAALVRHAVNEAGGAGRHFAAFTCAAGDPIAGCLRGIPRSTYRYALSVGSNARDYGRELARYTNELCYDDAALA